MNLRATEFEARVWRVARERLAKRPKLLAEFSRRRWSRWWEMFGLLLAGIVLPVPVFSVAVQMARGAQFPGGKIDDGMALTSAGILMASYVFALTWRAAGRADGIWTILQTQPFSDSRIAQHWMLWRVGFAIVFSAPIAAFHAIVLNKAGIGWGPAMTWGTVLGAADLVTLMATTLLLAAAFGRWFDGMPRVILIGIGLVVLTLVCLLPIQIVAGVGRAPPVQVLFEGRRLLWWPTGWPLAAFEAVLQGNFVRAGWWLGAVGVWAGAGLAAAITLIRGCSIREFGTARMSSQLWPLFDQESVWGPTKNPEPRVLSKWEAALSGQSQTQIIDLVKLDTSDDPLPAEEARREVLRGEFLRPLDDDKLGWIEKILQLSFFERERTLTHWLLIDGRYWTRAVTAWWACFWFTAIWFACGGLLQGAPLAPAWVVVPVGVLTFGLCIMTTVTTFWTIFVGWPALIWLNSANKGLPLFAHLPVSPRELSALRQRVILLKLIVMLVLCAPIFVGIAWVTGQPLWPMLKVLGKLAFALFVVQSWWFIGWQLSGSFFRTISFYIKTIVLFLAYAILTVFFLVGDDHLEWSMPLMVLCAKVMTWLLGRTLDRPVFDLTGANMSRQTNSFSLQLETPKT